MRSEQRWGRGPPPPGTGELPGPGFRGGGASGLGEGASLGERGALGFIPPPGRDKVL